MTQSIALNANHDIYTVNGNILLTNSLAAVMQNCQTAMLAQMGEMIYATTSGMPTDSTAWSNYNPRQFEASARVVLLAVQGVTSILAFNVILSNNVMNYGATIQTSYGVATI